MMKIGYFADGPWSHLALEKIIRENNFEISFIVPRFKYQDPVLKDWSIKLDVDFLPLKNINEDSSLKTLESYECDIFVSMSFNQIFKSEIINLTQYGFINCHASALPFYRGRNNLNWVLINDEKEFGVTVHHIDEGIDTGDIILQKKYPITDEDDYQTLLDRSKRYCAEILYESLILIDQGEAERIEQNSIDPVGSYSKRRGEGDEWIDWTESSREIFNFIRGITVPGPMARSKVDDHLIHFVSSSIVHIDSNDVTTPGEIVDIEKNYVTIKTVDGFLKAKTEENINMDKLLIGRKFKS